MVRMARLPIISTLSLSVFLAAAVWIARVDRAGPPHGDVALPGGGRATVYLPGSDARRAFLDPPPPEERPPAVVVMHGFAGDRNSMSGISRRIAASGYAVLNLDLDGHGENRTPYARVRATSDGFYAVVADAVDFLRTWPFVDGSRIAVMGHSMGAAAALDYATRDSGIDAAVLVSGGRHVQGPFPPGNVLFLYAAGDPDRVRDRSHELAARLAGLDRVEPGRTYGRHDRRAAVRVALVPGANHQTVVWMEDTVREAVAWLDASFGVGGSRSATPADERAPALALLGVAFLGVLPGLGLLVGRLVPAVSRRPGDGRGWGLAAIAAAFALTMPLVAAAPPAPILSAMILDTVVPHFALAGIALLVGVRLRRPELFDGLFARPGATLLGAAVAIVALYTALVPMSVVLHRVTLTPERLAIFGMSAAGFFPLALAFNLLLRRGSDAAATLFAVAGRLLVLAVFVVGVALGVLPGVLLLMLPALTGVSLLFEAFAAPLYASSGNLVAVALVDAAWLAIVVAAIVPVRV